jgi:tape measure domain-containing protein
MAGRFSVEAVFKAVDRVTAPVSRMQNRLGKMTRSMERGLRSANRALDKFVGSLASAGKSVLKFGTAGVGVLTASVGLLVREFSKVENAEAAFTPLLGGAERARQAVDALNETAASTPFQFETLASAANQLLPVMNGNIEDTVKTLRMLGDTAGGNAQKLDSITRGFTKAMLKGKVDMESLNMIAEAGVPIFGDLAEVMGTEVNEAFFKMISAGKVTTTQLTKAFEKMTSKGGKFFNGMEIASKTTSGLFSTLKDNISLTAAELGGVLAPTVKELIKGATEAAKRVREWVKNNRELISEKFIAFVELAKSSIMGFIENLRSLNRENSILERMGEIVVGVSNAFRFLGEHGKTILKLTAVIVGLSLVVKGLIAVMTLVNLVMAANPITLIVLGVMAAIAAFSALVIWIDDVAAAFDNMNPFIRAILAPLELVVRTIQFIKDALKDGFGGAVTKLAARFGFGGDDESTAEQSGGATGPQIVSPQDRVARSIEEKRTKSTAEVTIKDETGRAELTDGKLGTGLSLQPTGAF